MADDRALCEAHQRFLHLWNSGDSAGLVDMLDADVEMVLPAPQSVLIKDAVPVAGREACARQLRRMVVTSRGCIQDIGASALASAGMTQTAFSERRGPLAPLIRLHELIAWTPELKVRRLVRDVLDEAVWAAHGALEGRDGPPPESGSSATESAAAEELPPCDADETFKIILIGNSGVGKSNLMAVAQQGCAQGFSETTKTTLNPEFGRISMPHPERPGASLRAQIWDTAGQERFQAICRSHYRRADGCLVVFDVASKPSLEAVHDWVDATAEYCDPDVLRAVGLVENKVDLLPTGGSGDQRPPQFVRRSSAEAVAREHGMTYWRASAKCDDHVADWDGTPCREIFFQLLLQMHQRGGGSAGSCDTVRLSAGGGGAGGRCAC